MRRETLVLSDLSFTDALIATAVGAFCSGIVNLGGAYVGSQIKGEDPVQSAISAGVGSALGYSGGKVVSKNIPDQVSKGLKDTASSVSGSVISEAVTEYLKGADK